MEGITTGPQQFNAVASIGVTWDNLALAVGSRPSDTVIPPHLLNWCALIPTLKVGNEYVVANGDVVHNLGESRCTLLIAEESTDKLNIASKVIEDVHKTLLVVSSMVKPGHRVVRADQDTHIRLSGARGEPDEACEWHA